MAARKSRPRWWTGSRTATAAPSGRHDTRDCEGCNDGAWHDQTGAAAARHQGTDRSNFAHRLSDRLDAGRRGQARGTGQSVKAVGKPLAGKTGTASESKRHLVRRLLDPAARPASLSASTKSAHPGQESQWAAPTSRAPPWPPHLPRFHEKALADQPPTPFRVAQGIEEIPVTGGGAVVPAGNAGRCAGSSRPAPRRVRPMPPARR